MTKPANLDDVQNKTRTQTTKPSLVREQQQALNNIINQHAIVSIANAAGNITYVNDKFCEISGYTRAELVGQNHRIIQSGKHSKQFFRELWQTISQGKSWHGLIENRKKDGSPYWVQTTISPILDERDKPQQYLSIRTDVSTREQVKHELQHFKHALDQTLDCIFIFDARTLRFSYVNKGAIEQVGYSEKELLNKFAFSIKPEFDEAAFRKMIVPLLTGKQRSRTFETVHAHKSGKQIPVEILLQYLPASIDCHAQFIAVVRDITERKRMVDSLESLSVAGSTENVFLDIALAVSKSLQGRWAGIGKLTADKMIETIAFCYDGQTEKLFSYPITNTPCADVCGKPQSLCVEDHLMDRYSAPIHPMFIKNRALSYRGEPLIDQSGKVMGVLWVISDNPCYELADKRALMKIAAKRAALELQRMNSEKLLAQYSEQLYETLERINDGFFSLDEKWNFSYLNSTSSQIFSENNLDFKGRCIWDVIPEIVSFFFKPLKKSMKSQCSIDVEGFYAPRNIWIEMHIYPSVNGLSVYLRDISERKIIEQKQREIEARSHLMQKMEVIGQLTAGIAHDFNNILGCIMGYTELALTDCVDVNKNKIKGYLQRVYTASERGRDLVLQMMSFSRGSETNVGSINPLSVVKETIKMLHSTLPANIDVTFDKPSQNIPNIAISEGQLQQIIMNLCINARDAMKGAGHINLNLRVVANEFLNCDSCYKHQEMNNFVELTVHDNGSGIEPHIIGKLFEPFYTTKDIGKGTGLGLFVVHTLIHEYGGHLMVESLPGKGTTFRLFFPEVSVTNNKQENHHHINIAPLIKQLAGKNILLVDDEKNLLAIMRNILEAEGFIIDSYSDSREALAFFKQNHEQIDLVITDVNMPNLTGMELAYELRNLNSDIPIIICSGYNEELSKNSIIDYGLNGFLSKPYNKASLLSLVVKVLQSPSR